MSYDFFLTGGICLLAISCNNFKIITSCKNIIQKMWGREEKLKNKLTLDKDYGPVDLVVEIIYNTSFPYQNIFLDVEINDETGKAVLNKKDQMIMLFDGKGRPINRQIFGDMSLRCTLMENFHLKSGTYNVNITQKTRMDKLRGVEKIKLLVIKY